MSDDAGRSRADPKTAAAWLAAIRERENAGDLLAAFDLTQHALAAFADPPALRHRALLILARAGARREARRLFHLWQLDSSDDPEIAALDARLVKDEALAEADPQHHHELAALAADKYAAIHRRTGHYYPGINAATLSLIAGEQRRSQAFAAKVLQQLERARDDSVEDRYYRLATRAEGLLLLGEQAAAREALAQAAEAAPHDFSARATTRKQLQRIIALLDQAPAVLEPLAAPTVAHFTGHIIAAPGGEGRFPAEEERRVAADIEAAVREHDIRFGFGSLAAGADIIAAEAILERGGEIHVVLPFQEEEFVEISVRPAGESWVARYRRCLQGASRVSFATEDRYLGDDMLFGYCARYCMGLALLRARYIDAPLMQLAVWDGQAGNGHAGTAGDVAFWRELGLPRAHIEAGGRSAAVTASGDGGGQGRINRAMLFGDIKGYSKLGDAAIPAFIEKVMGRMAEVLERHDAAVEAVETWGDALYVVFTDVASAAHCALDLQAAVDSLDKPACGLPEQLALRIGAHYGPVCRVRHPVLRQTAFVGAQVSRAARIEPVAIPGTVYVSEPFAAILELHRDPALGTDYIGQVEAAKQYGAFAMYRLYRDGGADGPFPEGVEAS